MAPHLHIISDGDFSTLALDMQAQLVEPDKYWRTFFHYADVIFDIVYYADVGFKLSLSNTKLTSIYMRYMPESELKLTCDEMIIESIHES